MRFLLFLLACPCFAAPIEAFHATIAYYEGCTLTPYRDNGGNWCVGYGHNLTAHHERIKARYTRPEIEQYLIADTAVALETARNGIDRFDELSPDAQIAALHIAYQCGPTGFIRFVRFRRELSHRQYREAAIELIHSRWYGQTGTERVSFVIDSLLNLQAPLPVKERIVMEVPHADLDHNHPFHIPVLALP